jgi:transposase
MPYRPYPSAPSAARLRQLVPELPADHLARLVEQVVEEFVVPPPKPPGKGNPEYDPRLCAKVLLYGYATGTRSTHQLERLCRENLAYLFLTRGEAPSYHTLCNFRNDRKALLEEVWVGLFAVAERAGLKRVGRVVIDSTKMRANASPEAVLTRDEFAPVREELQRILRAAQEVDTREDREGYPGQTHLGKPVPKTQMRDILRHVRRRLAREQAAAKEREQAAAKERERAPETSEEAPSGTAPRFPPAAPPPGEAAPATVAGGEGIANAAVADGAAAAGPTAVEAKAAALPAALCRLTRQMIARIHAALLALAVAEAAGLKHLCLTDPDARMMGEGREKKIRECHSWEVVTDNGMLVVGQTTQETADNARLEPLLAAAEVHEPHGITSVTADCGLFAGDAVGRVNRRGIETCIPDSNTACDLHRGDPIGTQQAKTRGSVVFVYDAEAGLWRCEEGNELVREQQRRHYGQQVTTYRTRQSCEGCPRAPECLSQPGAKHRTLMIGEYHKELAAARERFREAEHREQYRHRGEAVEGVFGFVRGTLGYPRWLLRGTEGVAREGQLFKLAYQLRTIHRSWAG